ncbi:hypothetical protein BK004_03575 [bacterium CG10_46_32]|nr:MAG: hypothetical protein BK004_03575 [bacterium CG10_46_32]PIR55932.1 MAG: hypothetical protein COU73_03605 [Parcubacteria group bacterium CG10_big_fil_rev_8_21_14_0_10_46_32]
MIWFVMLGILLMVFGVVIDTAETFIFLHQYTLFSFGLGLVVCLAGALVFLIVAIICIRREQR